MNLRRTELFLALAVFRVLILKLFAGQIFVGPRASGCSFCVLVSLSQPPSIEKFWWSGVEVESQRVIPQSRCLEFRSLFPATRSQRQ
jgi:hypothetical protein